jgi:hypothetical protein
MIRPEQRAADRTTLPNRLKTSARGCRRRARTLRLSAMGVSPCDQRPPREEPKMSGAEGASIRAGARALAEEADRLYREFISQARPPNR